MWMLGPKMAAEADYADDKVALKQGSIKIVRKIDKSQVICERVTQRTEDNKLLEI